MNKFLLAIVLMALPLSTLAEEQLQDRPHYISTSASFALSHDKSGYDFKSDDFMIGLDVFYSYHFNNEWAVELGFRAVAPEPFVTIFTAPFEPDLILDDAKSFRLVANYGWQLNKRHSIIYKLGAQFYDVNYIHQTYKSSTKDGKTTITAIKDHRSTDGVSVFAGVGWRMHFDSGWELGVSYDFQPMDVINVQTLNLDFGYRF
ncbi:outer membrane beta-barrel protein [Parashewanella tropica]|uniref:outer membrane beta-barrel protein n=1 Tax=Parashewanella tropica TaxID=2547970 RepID=UPI0014790EB3|nr:outer membrane beta-barrel protein [Parashewanella tropica]